MGAGGEEEDGVHKALGGRLALRGLSGGRPRPAAPAERLSGGRDLRAVPLEVEERLLEAVVGEGGAGRRPGQDGGGSPRPEPLRQLLLEAGPGVGSRRAEAATPRGPAAPPERVEEPEGPAEAGQAEAAAQVVEEPQGAALEPRPPPRAGRVQQEHHAVGARHDARPPPHRRPNGRPRRARGPRQATPAAITRYNCWRPRRAAPSLAAAEGPPPHSLRSPLGRRGGRGVARLRNAAPALAAGGGRKGGGAPAVRAALSADWPAAACVRGSAAFHWPGSV